MVMVIDPKPKLTFDDVLLQPRYAGFLRSDVDFSTQLTPKIKLRIPLVSSPMDTVTESALAIALARAGGIGFIHRNLAVADQAKEVKKVKKQGLLVGAAVGSSPGYEERVNQLVKAGVDVLVVDSAHGHSKQVMSAVKTIKKTHKKVEVAAGNVATAAGAKALIEAGADALRVGMGPGAICTTRIVSGMGVPQLSAIIETASLAKKYKIPIIADGGIVYPADIVKALAAGASTVMIGRLFAGTNESSGQKFSFLPQQVPSRFKSIIKSNKRHYQFKQYRGMGSKGSMETGMKVSSEDEFHGKNYKTDAVLIAEGVDGLIPCTGSLETLAQELTQALISGLYYTGARNLQQLYKNAVFQKITEASLKESHPHNLFVTDHGGAYLQ